MAQQQKGELVTQSILDSEVRNKKRKQKGHIADRNVDIVVDSI